MGTNNDINRKHLRTMLDALINKDDDKAKTAFHDYVVNRSKSIVEGSTTPAGSEEVKNTVKKAGDAEIVKKGEEKDDPKLAKADPKVKAALKKAGDAEIPKKGEESKDSESAKGSSEVKSTMKKAGDAEIKK